MENNKQLDKKKTGTVDGRIILNKHGWKVLDQIHFAEETDQWQGFVRKINETPGSIIFGKFIVKLRQTRLCCVRLSGGHHLKMAAV